MTGEMNYNKHERQSYTDRIRRVLVNTELKNAVTSTDKEAQYDASAKRLLGQKIILAHILAKTVDEFKGMKPKDIVPFIEGEPYIGSVRLNPDLLMLKVKVSV